MFDGRQVFAKIPPQLDGRLFGKMGAREKVMCMLSHKPMNMKFKRPIVKDTYFDVKLYEPKLGKDTYLCREVGLCFSLLVHHGLVVWVAV